MAFYDIILWKWKVHNLSEPKYLHLVKKWTFTILPTVMFQFYIKQFYYKVIKYWFYNTDFWILPYYRISSYLKLVTWLVTPTPLLKKRPNWNNKNKNQMVILGNLICQLFSFQYFVTIESPRIKPCTTINPLQSK